jgi:hypothetical protein
MKLIATTSQLSMYNQLHYINNNLLKLVLIHHKCKTGNTSKMAAILRYFKAYLAISNPDYGG